MSDENEQPRTRNIISILSKILNEIIEENKNIKNGVVKEKNPKNDSYSLFYCKTPPVISIEAYLERILKYSKLEDSSLIISLIYLDRVCDKNNVELINNNIHR